MVENVQAVEQPASAPDGGQAASVVASPASSRLAAAGLRRRLLASVTGADVAAILAEAVRLSLDRSGTPRDQLAACRLVLEYAVGKPGAVEGDGAAAGPRFVFQFAGPVSVGVEPDRLRPRSSAGLLDQGDRGGS